MKKIITLTLLIISLFLIGCTTEEDRIKKEIENANYCNTSADCVLVGSKCPFDCYIYSNSAEADRIKGLVDNFESTCQYSCIRCPTVECKDNKCVPVCE